MKRTILWLSSSIYRVFSLYLISLAVCALMFSWIEAKSLLDSVYWACITSLTIGYGDIAPVTKAGRVLAMFFSHFWVFGIAPLIISNMLSITLEDRNLFTHEEQEEMKALLRKVAEKA